MDVDIPEIPARYDGYRTRLREFIGANRPTLSFTPRVGLRVPDDPDDVAALRRWVRSLHDAGFVVARHGSGDTGEFIALAEQVSGENLGPFFQRWLFERGKP